MRMSSTTTEKLNQPRKKRVAMSATIVCTLPDTYFDLVKQFPLVHINDDGHLTQAQEFLDGLLKRDLDEGGAAYLNAMSDLIEIYEEAREPSSDASAEDVLRELVNASGLSQQALSKAVGIAQSTISAFLTGDRKMTTGHIMKLSRYFEVSPAVFLPR